MHFQVGKRAGGSHVYLIFHPPEIMFRAGTVTVAAADVDATGK